MCLCGVCLLGPALQLVSAQAPEAKPATSAQDAKPAAGVQQAGPYSLLLDLVVTDKSGNPVPGLTERDITVLDNRQPAKILSFSAHNEADIPAGGEDDSTEVIVVVDEVNADYQKVTYVRDGVRKFLTQAGAQLMWPVSLAFFADSGLQVQGQPTTDGAALVHALDQQARGLREVMPGTWLGGEQQLLQRSLDALAALIARCQKMPGRKMVIWIGPGWPMFAGPLQQISPAQKQRVFDQVVALSSAMRQARMTLYSVDPLGAGANTMHAEYYQTYTRPLEQVDHAALADFELQVLAEQTGGRALFGGATIDDYLRHCTADLSAFYTIAVEKKRSETAPQFHSIEVRVDQPKYKVRTRNGYYAVP